MSDKLHSREFNGRSIVPHAVSVEGKRMIFVSDAFFKCTDIRHEYFGPSWPTSTTLEVSRLAQPDMPVKIEAVAVVG